MEKYFIKQEVFFIYESLMPIYFLTGGFNKKRNIYVEIDIAIKTEGGMFNAGEWCQ